MNWQPTNIYQMSNGTDKVVFQINEDGKVLVCNHKTRNNKFMMKKAARKLWKEYSEKGYQRI